MKEFEALPPEQVPRYLELIRRINKRDDRVEFKKLGVAQAKLFGVNELWEAKASKKLRLFLDGMGKPQTILGFGHRGQSTLFRRER